MYHEIESPYEFLWRLRPSLTPDGQVIVVDAPTELQVSRMVDERGWTREDAEARIAAQATREGGARDTEDDRRRGEQLLNAADCVARAGPARLSHFHDAEQQREVTPERGYVGETVFCEPDVTP